jgi:outer membrane protein, heavy metal efflux system
MKSIIHILFFVSLSICSQGQTLEEYLKEAAKHNPDIKAGFSEFNAALQKIPQVNTLPDPTVSLGVFVSPIETRVGAQRAKLSLSQIFPWFGTLQAREDAASLMAEAKFKEISVAKNELFLNVKQTYFPIYETMEHIRINEENLKILDTYKQLSTIKYANGKVPLTDILRVDIMLENVKTDIKILHESLNPLYVSFNRLLNRNDTLIVHIENPLLLPINENSIEAFIKTNPSLQLIDARIEAEIANENLAKLKSKPNFGIGLDYAMISKRKDVEMAQNGKDVLMPMVTLSLPIFKKKNVAFVKESQLIQIALSERKEGMENKLWSTYSTASFEVDRAKELYQHYQNQIDRNSRIINLLYTAYANSGRDFEEVLRVQQETLKYEMTKATVLKNYHLAIAKIDFITAKNIF